MDNNSVGSNNTKDDIRYFPESIVKVSIDMDEYLRLKEIERECIRLRSGGCGVVKEEPNINTCSVFVEERDVCYDRLQENLYNELEVLYTRYRGSAMWNLDSTLSGVIAFHVKYFLEDSIIDWDSDDCHRKIHRELKYAYKVLHYYFKKGDSWKEKDVRCVRRALKFLRRNWFAMWT